MLERLFAISLAAYVDDGFAVEPGTTVWSAFEIVPEIPKLLGLELEDDKAKKPSNDLVLLGAQVAFNPGAVSAGLPSCKRAEMARGLRLLLSKGTLGPAGAAKWRGELGYFQTLLFGRAGRVMLRPFSERQYSARAHAKTPFPHALRDVAPWWVAIVESSGRRRISARKHTPVSIYTDACGAGHLGAVVYLDDQMFVAHTHSPKWIMEADASISGIGLLAEFPGLTLARAIAPRRPILLRCDNTRSAATVIRGSRRTPIGRMIVATFGSVAAIYRCPVWVESVASKRYPSGKPSRVCPLLPPESRCSEDISPRGVPAMFRKACASRHALATAQFNGVAASTGRSEGWPCSNVAKSG